MDSRAKFVANGKKHRKCARRGIIGPLTRDFRLYQILCCERAAEFWAKLTGSPSASDATGDPGGPLA
jgi:hypothetical protein